MSSRNTGVRVRRMDPRDGVGLWRVVREQRGSFAGPFSFMMLAQRYWPTSAVLEDDDEIVGYLLARRDEDTLRILDCEIGASGMGASELGASELGASELGGSGLGGDSAAERALLWELLQIAVDPHDEVAYVDLPCAIGHRIRRAYDAPARPARGPRLAKASPLEPSAERSLGRDGEGAFSRALA